MLGRTVGGNFRLLGIIGTGAMGTIYKAEQLSLGKTVVIKLLHRHLLVDPTLARRFHREARAASLLNHPNCIQVIDFGEAEDGSLYIAMEFVKGRDLAEVLFREFPLDARRTVHIVKQIALALDEAHAAGVVHRDLKPENIVVEDRRNMKDFVKVLDFGIAKLQDKAAAANTFQTVAGVVCGTPEYMSPEQARGETLDGRTDLYALGVLLYQLLTNRLPFDGDSPLAVVSQHLGKDPAPPREIVPDVPQGLEALALSLMAKDREARPQSALDLVAELERIDRDIEAARIRAEDRRDDDPTMVDMRPPVMADAPRSQTPASGASPQPRPTGVMSAAEAAAAVAAAAETAPPDAPLVSPLGPRTAGSFRRHGGGLRSARVWLLAILLSAAVAVAGWLLYRSLATETTGPAATTEEPASRHSGAGEERDVRLAEAPPRIR
ncbi:MAG: serine/threonine-protein kinase [Myxococcota bacterium]